MKKGLGREGFKLVAGVDEAGRGPLAGPVVAAACIIPDGLFFPGVNDSKKLTASKRQKLFAELSTHPKAIYHVGICSHEEIDQMNIYQATLEAMRRAIAGLSIQPDYLLVDGMPLSHSILSEKIIGGDAVSFLIAAASIIAKETRDRLMLDYDRLWPQYGFKQHKGYGTKKHCEAISTYGPLSHSPHDLCPSQVNEIARGASCTSQKKRLSKQIIFPFIEVKINESFKHGCFPGKKYFWLFYNPKVS